MSRVPHLPRPRGAVLIAVVTAMLAFPLGVLASHQFSDVPDSYIFHDDIDALVDNGITGGCGGGKYCPSAYVTRGQMAAFMNRLGSLDGNTTPSVNAANAVEVNGWDVGCPDGTTWAGGLCLETTVRTAANVYDASATCVALGSNIFLGRGQQWMLPSILQLRGAHNNNDIDLDGSGEWSDSFFVDDTDGYQSMVAYPFGDTASLILNDDATASHPYRCGAVPLSFDPISIVLPLDSPESGLPAAIDSEIELVPLNADGTPK